MKVRIGLPREAVQFLKEHARIRGLDWSAAGPRPVRMLRASQLTAEYCGAFQEWDSDNAARVWDQSTADRIE
jgi:hypothetical protein